MESTFRIQTVRGGPPLETVFGKISDVLCRECGLECQQFFLTTDYDEYLTHRGPKIGWVIHGEEVMVRMANCRQVAHVAHVSQLLQLFDMRVLESQVIQ